MIWNALISLLVGILNFMIGFLPVPSAASLSSYTSVWSYWRNIILGTDAYLPQGDFWAVITIMIATLIVVFN